MPGPHIPVIVTRAQPGCGETAARLLSEGLMAIEAPALVLREDLAQGLPDLSGKDLVFTSANGVRAFISRSSLRSVRAWCVGPATADAAREAGFTSVEQSSGNARDLANYIMDRRSTGEGGLVHIANGAAKGDLQAILNEAGYSVEFCPLYHMDEAPSLPPVAIKTLQAQLPCIVMVHSAKGALAFHRLADGLPTQHLVAVSISPAAAEPLMRLGVGEIHFAPTLDEAGLFTALSVALATLSA
ncbi:MAG: uroporphyrinogen-III synthase [Pseudomonadota bacterium]